nr:hypothetical protein [Dysosmobacter welbionis]
MRDREAQLPAEREDLNTEVVEVKAAKKLVDLIGADATSCLRAAASARMSRA